MSAGSECGRASTALTYGIVGARTASVPSFARSFSPAPRMRLLCAGTLTGSVTAPPKGPTFQFGEYILSYQDCRECHGARLTGGVPGQIGPLGPDLNLVAGWRLVDFIATMRTGIDRLLAEPTLRRPLAGIRLALLAHPASVTQELTHSFYALAALGELQLTAAFGPQHGLPVRHDR